MIEVIKLLMEKLSQYNFVTNILPGTILCVLLKYVIGYDLFVTEDWYLMGIVFYFVGMINNRFGSLFVERGLRKVKFVEFAPYGDFVETERKDKKIKTLSSENNAFRSYISKCVLLLLTSLFKLIADKIEWKDDCKGTFLILALLVLFLLSYQKQTSYIRKRIEANLK